MNNQIEYLIDYLLEEMPDCKHINIPDPKLLLRSLMNLRPPMKLSPEFLKVQDEYLGHERDMKGIIDAEGLPEIQPGISLWQGDITRLKAGAVVNAANSELLGCFIPCHGCIDNAIHSAAGLQLRDECSTIMKAQGHPEPAGQAKITRGYNLPAQYVIHTVGPIVGGELTTGHIRQLTDCYRSCLELALAHKLRSIAFCCISTGEFHFPQDRAAVIATSTVRAFLNEYPGKIKVIFNVFKDSDLELYSKELEHD